MRMRLLAGTGAVLLVLLAIIAGAAGDRVMPSFLAGWLFVLSVPLGALLLVTGLMALGVQSVPLPPLRALLVLMPLAALAGLPVLLFAGGLYHAGAWPADGAGRSWFGRGAVAVRMVLFLALWSGLALAFSRPRRPSSAGLAFALVLVTGTMAAFDWGLAVEPGLASSSFGLLLLAGDAVSAIAAAALLAGAEAAPRYATPMLALLAVWGFLHIEQFLVVWSANQPDEARWYLERTLGLGTAAVAAGALLLVVALGLLMPRAAAVGPRAVLLIAALVLPVRLLESFWLITPAFRGDFTVEFADLLAAAGLVALLVGLRPEAGRWRHVRN